MLRLPCPPPKGHRTLWVFNDNEQDRSNAKKGDGTAKIRPFNSHGPHRAAPLSPGVTTGSHGKGFASLDAHARALIDADLAHIGGLLATGDYGCVKYSCGNNRDNRTLGSRTFKFGRDVNEYIVAGLERCVASAWS